MMGKLSDQSKDQIDNWILLISHLKESILYQEDKMDYWEFGIMTREYAIMKDKDTLDQSIRLRYHQTSVK